MITKLTQLRLEASKTFETLRPVKKQTDRVESWVHYVRKVLNMSVEQLSKRTDLAPPTIYQAERNERLGQINMSTLAKLADAMGCDLVYGFVPRVPLMNFLKNQATQKALEQININKNTKNLSPVEVDALRMELDEVIQEFLKSRKLWND